MYNKVKCFRKQVGMKQSTLAAYANIGRSTLSEIETNKHLPKVDIAIRIAQALKRSVEELWII